MLPKKDKEDFQNLVDKYLDKADFVCGGMFCDIWDTTRPRDPYRVLAVGDKYCVLVLKQNIDVSITGSLESGVPEIIYEMIQMIKEGEK